MVEVQSHGFIFEKWVRENLFDGYTGNYTQSWDVPSIENTHKSIPKSMRNLPVSIKTAKYGSPIGLGDALRQRSIQEPFLMIVGFWKQRTQSEKWFEDIGCAVFSPDVCDSLWGQISSIQLRELDEMVKDITQHYETVRQRAKKWKRDVASHSESIIVINPKIDSKKQRRVQCSLPFFEFWKHAGRDTKQVDIPNLFGFDFQNPVIKSPRTFN